MVFIREDGVCSIPSTNESVDVTVIRDHMANISFWYYGFNFVSTKLLIYLFNQHILTPYLALHVGLYY